MIEAIDLGIISPIMIVFCGVLMVVLRAGASRVFFDVVGTFQAQRMMDDVEATVTTMNAIMIDGLSGMEEAGAMVAEQMQKIVEATVPLSQELEMATLEFQKFVSEAEGARLASEVRDVGLQFGFTSQQSLEAGARMAQLSSMIGENAVPAATEMALAFGLIGDMTPETAMLKLINLQQQTAFVFEGTTKAAYDQLSAEEQRLKVRQEMANVLNTLNKVEDNSAATMTKITGVMNEFASQAHLAGEEISMMAAMSATLIEAGEEQGKGGRALRMIYARLGADTSGAASFLQELGVETQTADGSLRALSDILADLNPHWEKMTAGQKQTTAQMVAGNRHYVRFLKLAENYDRIQQLNAATMGDMGAVYNESGEAVGFLNQMMNSNAVALDSANAKLELVNSQIGDFFIPTTVKATEFQALFNEQLLIMLEDSGRMGDLLQGMFEFQQIISGVFAPFFSAMINVKAMNMALMTQRQITRALMGEELKKGNVTKTSREKEKVSLERIEQTHKELINLSKTELIQKHHLSTKTLEFNEKEIAANKEKITHLKMVQAAVHDGIQTETHMFMIKQKHDAYEKARQKQETHFIKHKFTLKDGEIQQTHQSNDVTRRHRRYIEELNLAQEDLNFAIEEHIRKLDLENQRVERRNVKLAESKNLINGKTGALRGVTAATNGSTAAMEKQTAAIMRMSMSVMKFGMVLFVAEMVVLAFKDAIPGIGSEAEAARVALILMGMAMAVMMGEMIVSTSATIAHTGVTKAATLAQKAQATWTGLTTGALTLQTLATNAASGAWVFLKAVMSYGAFLVIAIGIAVAINKYILPSLKDMTEDSLDAADAFDTQGDAAEKYANRVSGAFDDVGGAYSDFFNSTTDDMNEFSSAREELFFGFKAGQVTGDLIKQVQQKGVENFVANTEIIMNNTFNGLTTDELAEEVISQIERRAGIGGINTAIAS